MAVLDEPADLVLPAQATLDKYGITMDEWLAFIPEKDGRKVCRICERPPRTGRFVVDHKHVPKWKLMPADERRRYVRGVICTTCNHYVLTRYGSPLRHRNAAQYLEDFERRFDNG
jgi:hypothetical protein